MHHADDPEETSPRAAWRPRDIMNHQVVAGVDIGGTSIHALLMTPGGKVLSSRSVPTRAGGRTVLRQVQLLVGELQRRTAADIVGVGVGATGIIETGTGRVLVSTSAFRDWVGHRLADELESLLNLPVIVSNDIKAFLMGELRWGAVQDVSNVLGVTIGTGVGGAIALDGRIVEGQFGGAGEIGHLPGYSDRVCGCGGVGHLETVASGPAIGLRYAQRTGTQKHTGLGVARRARTGDPDALAVIEDAGRALADALLAAVTLLDIGHVVVGGGVVGAWDLLAPLLNERIAANPPISGDQLVVRPSTVPFPAMGAASLVTQSSGFALAGAGTADPEPARVERQEMTYSTMSGTKT